MILKLLGIERYRRMKAGKPKYITLASLGQDLRDLIIWFFIVYAMNTMGMMYFEPKLASLGDATWFTAVASTTVGFGDLFPETTGGRIVVGICIFTIGIPLLAAIVGNYIEWRNESRFSFRIGRRFRHMIKQVNFYGTTENNILFPALVAAQLRADKQFEKKPFRIITDKFPNGLPNEMYEVGIEAMLADPSIPKTIRDSEIDEASHVVIFAENAFDPASDDTTIALLTRIREMIDQGKLSDDVFIVAECVSDENRRTMRWLGANSVVMPIRANPGHLAMEMIAPGCATLMEDDANSSGIRHARVPITIHASMHDIHDTLFSHETKDSSGATIMGLCNLVAVVDSEQTHGNKRTHKIHRVADMRLYNKPLDINAILVQYPEDILFSEKKVQEVLSEYSVSKTKE